MNKKLFTHKNFKKSFDPKSLYFFIWLRRMLIIKGKFTSL